MIRASCRTWIAAGLTALFLCAGCQTAGVRREAERAVRGRPGRTVVVETTGYCPCGKCCGWKRNWLGRPVVASGPRRGAPKKVGYTASGTRAQPGTLAADTKVFPFGTILYIPGYGYGRVEDRGGGIQGYQLDLFFRSHAEAMQWGRVKKRVKVWYRSDR